MSEIIYELRNLVNTYILTHSLVFSNTEGISINKTKQIVFENKLHLKLTKCRKDNTDYYIIRLKYLPKWFDDKYEQKLITKLRAEGYDVSYSMFNRYLIIYTVK